ncbi:hypothetical protein PARU111607_10345 [Palleronia rufa]
MKKAEEAAFDRAWRFRDSYFRELEDAKATGAKIAVGYL